ncbi:MAG: 50S ribosomal protein L10 [Acidobacteria bacterium]|nr:50S ribosomal protein L10 [Acidobacteriota bacterium]
MDKQTKRDIVDQLKAELQGVDSIFLCNFKGMTVEKDTNLRRDIRAHGSTYRVVKNTLLKLAFADSEFAQLNDQLVGNTAMAYHEEDIVGLAKLIAKAAKDNEKFEFKAGIVQGQVIDLKQLETLANLPSKEQLVSKLMYLMNYPIQGLATALNGIVRNFVVVLDQVKQQKEQ